MVFPLKSLASRSRNYGVRPLIVLLTLFAIAVVVLGGFLFSRQRDQIRATARDEVQAIARLKIESIQRWRQERFSDAQWIFEASSFSGRARDFFVQPADPLKRADLIRWMDGWCRSGIYRRVLLLDSNLRVRLETPSGESSLSSVTAAAISSVWQSRQALMVDLHRDSESGPAMMDLVIPLVEGGGSEPAVGVLVFEIDPQRFLFPHIQSWPTPSRTAETLLVRPEAEEIVYLNELRHRAGAALKLRLPLASRELPAHRAVLGETGVIEGVDYRGERVLAALAAIPHSPWFIVAKRDLAEVDAPVRQWAWLLGVGVLVLIGAATAGVDFVWRTRETHFVRQELAERARAETALRESKTQLELALESAQMGAWRFSIAEGHRQFDDVTCRLLGLDPAGFKGSADEFYARVLVDDRPLLRAALQRSIEAGVPYEVEYRVVWPDGSVHHLAARARLEPDVMGRPTDIQGMLWDVTSHRRAEEALRSNEAQLRSLYTAMTEMLVTHEIVTDATGRAVDYRILECNPAFERATGIRGERARGALATAVYGATPPPYLETYARVAATGEPAHFEVFIPSMQRHFDISAFSPRPGQFATVTNDITERKQAEEALRESRQRLALHIEQTPLAVIEWDLDFRALAWNPAAEQIFGFTAKEAHGRTALELIIPASQRDHVNRVWRALLEGKDGRRSTNENLTRDGRTVLCDWFNTPLVDATGRTTAVASLVLDVTERRQHEEERDLLLHELERKNEELESMIYVASHDLRAPLVNVQGFGQRLEKACAELVAQAPVPTTGADTPPAAVRIAKALGYIRTSADKMEGLIAGLLRVSRVGRIIVNAQTVDMDNLLRQVAATLEFQIQQAGAILQLDPLPSCGGDPSLLSQVFTNLLDNALKYRTPGRPLRIAVSGQIDGREAVYCVEDTGLGMAAEHQNKIWEMFHRLQPEGPVAGEGLGLKVARRILDRHQGRIWVDSRPGAGSRFFVAIPRPERITPLPEAPR